MTTAEQPDSSAAASLAIENLGTARFNCVFPVCGGICCRNGRPTVTMAEQRRIDENLERFLPHLRERARLHAAARGWLTRRTKGGLRTIAVVDGWCIFAHEGCVLQKVGMAEGEAWKYKPAVCVYFPLEQGIDGSWYVRQWGHRDEAWDLFCLNPMETTTPARDSLKREIAFVEARERTAPTND